MEVKAKLRHLRIAPRKVRLVADQVRGKTVAKAKTFLRFTPKRATDPMLKLLDSAVANAKNEYNMDEANLYLSEVLVDEGAKIKRWMPRARGSASPIEKKTSHITVVLKEINETVKKEKKRQEKVEVVKVDEVKEEVDKEKPKRVEKRKASVENTTSRKVFRRKSI